MSGFIDRMFDKSAFLSAVAERALQSLFRTTALDNAAVTLAATAACGLSAVADEPLRSAYPIFFGAMLLSWAFASAAAGFLRQWFFLLYAGGMCFLPHLFIDAAQSPTRSEEFTAFNDALAHLAELIAVAAPQLLIETGMSRLTVSQYFFAGIALLFLAGFLIRRNARRHRFYCEVRLKIIPDLSEKRKGW